MRSISEGSQGKPLTSKHPTNLREQIGGVQKWNGMKWSPTSIACQTVHGKISYAQSMEIYTCNGKLLRTATSNKNRTSRMQLISTVLTILFVLIPFVQRPHSRFSDLLLQHSNPLRQERRNLRPHLPDILQDATEFRQYVPG